VNPNDLPPDEPLPEVGTVRRVRRGRRNLAALENLPVIRKEHDLPEDQKPCPCCGEMREKIGQESSWQVEFIPRPLRADRARAHQIRLHALRTKRRQSADYAGRQARPADRQRDGRSGPAGLRGHEQICDYLPLYRLENIFQRNGLEISRATQSVWCGDVADLLRPLYDLMVRRVLHPMSSVRMTR
jgi:transposase